MTAICKFTVVRMLAAGVKGSHAYMKGYKDALALVPYDVLLEMLSHRVIPRRPRDESEERPAEPVSISARRLEAWRQRPGL